MEIPIFKEKTLPVMEMEHHLEGLTTEGKQFNNILTAIKDYETIPSVMEMASILEYEEQALNYSWLLSFEVSDKHLEKDISVLSNFVYVHNPFKDYPTDNIRQAKYYVLCQVIEELKLIHNIKEAVDRLNNKFFSEHEEILAVIRSINETEKESEN